MKTNLTEYTTEQLENQRSAINAARIILTTDHNASAETINELEAAFKKLDAEITKRVAHIYLKD